MMRRFRVTQADAVMLASGEARTINVALQTGDNGQEVGCVLCPCAIIKARELLRFIFQLIESVDS